MAGRFCLPHSTPVVDICCRLYHFNRYCSGYIELPGNQSGDSQSCKEFENGVIDLLLIELLRRKTLNNPICWLRKEHRIRKIHAVTFKGFLLKIVMLSEVYL